MEAQLMTTDKAHAAIWHDQRLSERVRMIQRTETRNARKAALRAHVRLAACITAYSVIGCSIAAVLWAGTWLLWLACG